MEKLCWIDILNNKAFVKLGANYHELQIGQNITYDLSIKIKYTETKDSLDNTLDYGIVINKVKTYLQNIEKVHLLEYLAEQILNMIGKEFSQIFACKIVITKGYIPLENFTGLVKITAEKNYYL